MSTLKTIKTWWNKITYFPPPLPNDWELVFSDYGIWNIDRGSEIVVTYDIYWSRSRDQYKLTCEGYKCKDHPYYGKMKSKLAELNLKRIQNK